MGFFSWLTGQPKEENIADLLEEAEGATPEGTTTPSQPAKDELLAQLGALDEDQARQLFETQRQQNAGTYSQRARATVVRFNTLPSVGALHHLMVRLYVEDPAGQAWETDYELVCSDRIKAMIEPGATFDADYNPANHADVELRTPP